MKIFSPAELREKLPPTTTEKRFIEKSGKEVEKILKKKDKFIMIIGPCSIHNYKQAIDYAEKLKQLSDKVRDKILIVMRGYFEKPRTTIGWKGFIYDPDLNNSCNIKKGIFLSRKLLKHLTKIEIPVATEILNPLLIEYLKDFLTIGTIGARTSESQIHREAVSSMNFPVGFKNSTSGDIQIPINSILSSSTSHTFLGINSKGKISIKNSKGNKNYFIILRGGKKPNYYPKNIKQTEILLKKAKLNQNIIVDCSHGNSLKNHKNQKKVLFDILKQKNRGNKSILGIMLESNINEGKQPITKKLKYGVSITDSCISFDETKKLVLKFYNSLK